MKLENEKEYFVPVIGNCGHKDFMHVYRFMVKDFKDAIKFTTHNLREGYKVDYERLEKLEKEDIEHLNENNVQLKKKGIELEMINVEKLQATVKESGFTMVGYERLEGNLYKVIARRASDGEMAVWTYNSSMEGLYSGKYFMITSYNSKGEQKEKAFEYYHNKNK